MKNVIGIHGVRGWMLALACAVGSVAATAAAADPAAQEGSARTSSLLHAWGGEIEFNWNRDLAGDYGIQVSRVHGGMKSREAGFERLGVREATRLAFALRGNGFDGFRAGSVGVRGGFDLAFADGSGSIALRDFTLRARDDDPFVLDVVSGDGVAWFYIDRLMYEFETDPPALAVRAMDLRIAPVLAERLGQPKYAGHVIAAMRMTTRVHGEGFALPAAPKAPTGCGKWHDCDVTPGGPRYQADVFMDYFNAQYSRRNATTGRAVFTPSSTLRNNVNQGSSQVTIAPPPGMQEPLGTSTALHTADVPWYTKFTGNFNPHGNDQHPYLIWNLYRIDGDRITQVGRSGVKHAWLTTNTGAQCSSGDNHILGRACGDTYGTGNNDTTSDLGPRSEIVPAQGIWGRCGSVYDRDCNGVRDSGSPCSNVSIADCQTWAFRMAVAESDIDPSANPGATWMFESWYIVRDDINIYNTMQTVPLVFTRSGSAWIADDSPYQSTNPLRPMNRRLGPAIDRWVARGTSTSMRRSSDIDREEGEARVVAVVTDLGGGQYRYDYTVMNFDFAEAVITGTNPNLTVESNDGFTALSVLVPEGATISQIQFEDGDGNAANDWSSSSAAGSIQWEAVPGNALNWGMMYRFSFVTDTAPVESDLQLTTAQTGTPDHAIVTTLGPGGTGIAGYRIGGTASGLNGTDGADLSLNGAESLTVAADGGFQFTTTLQTGETYAVALVRQPSGRSCELDGEQGTVASSDVTSVSLDCVGFGVRGSASGVNGTDGVELRLNGSETITVVTDGGFAFASPLMTGENYGVTVARHPTAKTCVVTQGSGQIGSADVTGVQVSCTALPPDQVTIGGVLSGLAPGREVGLSLNAGATRLLGANGSFTFPGTLAVGDAYAVAVVQQPPAQDCSVVQSGNTVPAGGVTDLQVICVDGPVTQHSVRFALSGLAAGSQVKVQLNGGNGLTLTGNGNYVFGVLLSSGSTYHVTVSAQPAGQYCSVARGDGIIDDRNIDDVAIACVTAYTVGGSVSGLPAQESVSLSLNGGPALLVQDDGAFEFATAVASGGSYLVEVQASSAGAQCEIASGSTGTIQNQDIDSVQVQCEAVMFTVSGEVSGLQQGQTVTLRLNDGETLAGLGNGPFAFATGLPNRSAFSVAVVETSGGTQCSPTASEGSIDGADAVGIAVTCAVPASAMFSDGFED